MQRRDCLINQCTLDQHLKFSARCFIIASFNFFSFGQDVKSFFCMFSFNYCPCGIFWYHGISMFFYSFTLSIIQTNFTHILYLQVLALVLLGVSVFSVLLVQSQLGGGGNSSNTQSLHLSSTNKNDAKQIVLGHILVILKTRKNRINIKCVNRKTQICTCTCVEREFSYFSPLLIYCVNGM